MRYITLPILILSLLFAPVFPGNVFVAWGQLTADINGDGTVNIQDLGILLSNWNTANASSDINGDGTVNIQDLGILLSNWGKSVTTDPTPTLTQTPTPTPTATPTPTSAPNTLNTDCGGELCIFPGAEGFGVDTSAGRGGSVIHVTNLNETGPGSLHEALVNTSGPRTIVFDVSGTIVGSSRWEITNGDVFVAGQTAPSPGITLRNIVLQVRASDVVMQHIRVRVGDDPDGPNPGSRDNLQILDGSRIVMDHLSVSWAVDENVSVYPSDVTFSNTIISEGLHDSIHPERPHSAGMLISQGAKRIANIKNLFAHNDDRNPYSKGGTTNFLANNVIYNWDGSKAYYISGSSDPAPILATIVGNVFIQGVNSSASRPMRTYDTVPSDSEIYLADNTFDRQSPPADQWTLVRNEAGSSVQAGVAPLAADGLVALSSSETEQYVLANVGARPYDRDSADIRIVDEVRTGEGQVIDSTAQVGGWPVLSQRTRTLSIPPVPAGDSDGDGYTNLEEYLHDLAYCVEGRFSYIGQSDPQSWCRAQAVIQ